MIRVRIDVPASEFSRERRKKLRNTDAYRTARLLCDLGHGDVPLHVMDEGYRLCVDAQSTHLLEASVSFDFDKEGKFVAIRTWP